MPLACENKHAFHTFICFSPGTLLSRATAAYRRDLALNQAPFGPYDGTWITVTALAEQAAASPTENKLLSEAEHLARESMGDATAVRWASREWPGDAGPFAALTRLGDEIQEYGALNTAAVLLDSLIRASGPDFPVERARFLALRARVAYRNGETEAAQDLFLEVSEAARELGSDELMARAFTGQGTLAQLRGNYPLLFDLGCKAVDAATKTGAAALMRRAHFAAMRGAFAIGRREEAVHHGWKLVETSHGERDEELASIQSIGQLFLELGDMETAYAAFSHVLAAPQPYRILLPTLGGLAIIAANQSNAPRLDWAVRQITAARQSVAPRFTYAEALLEATTALIIAGRLDEAEALRREGQELATQHKLHELDFHAEALERSIEVKRRAARELDSRVSEIVQQVRRLETPHLPERLTYTTA